MYFIYIANRCWKKSTPCLQKSHLSQLELRCKWRVVLHWNKYMFKLVITIYSTVLKMSNSTLAPLHYLY